MVLKAKQASPARRAPQPPWPRHPAEALPAVRRQPHGNGAPLRHRVHPCYWGGVASHPRPRRCLHAGTLL